MPRQLAINEALGDPPALVIGVNGGVSVLPASNFFSFGEAGVRSVTCVHSKMSESVRMPDGRFDPRLSLEAWFRLGSIARASMKE